VLLVAITGYGGAHARRRSKEVGFDAHLTKPVNLRALERIISSLAS
jgi:CheY-like chemotaxis protein